MTLERGFRRLIAVVSVLVLGLGITFDAITLQPYATVQVTLEDGRKVMLDRHGPKDYLRELIDRHELRPIGPPTPGGGRFLTSITDVETIRGPQYLWWADSIWTKVGAVLVVLLWMAFFVVRWIAHGFTKA